jgi:hypothetical protein
MRLPNVNAFLPAEELEVNWDGVALAFAVPFVLEVADTASVVWTEVAAGTVVAPAVAAGAGVPVMRTAAAVVAPETVAVVNAT